MSHSNQPSYSKPVAKQESLLKVKTEEAQIGKARIFQSSLHFHPNVKAEKIKKEQFMGNESGEGDILESLPHLAIAKEEMFVYDLDMDDLLNNMDPYLYKGSIYQPFNSSLDIDQNTHVDPMPYQCPSQVRKSQAQPGSSYGTVKTDKGAYSGPTGMDDDEPIPTEMDNGAQCGLSCGPTEMDDDEPYWPLSGKPYFDMIFTKSQATHPYILALPSKIITELPSASVPAVITYCGKRWEMVYLGNLKCKRFNSDWENFVIDNKLKVGDGCFFELTANSPTRVKFRAQILRCPDLSDIFGSTSETPIIVE